MSPDLEQMYSSLLDATMITTSPIPLFCNLYRSLTMGPAKLGDFGSSLHIVKQNFYPYDSVHVPKMQLVKETLI